MGEDVSTDSEISASERSKKRKVEPIERISEIMLVGENQIEVTRALETSNQRLMTDDQSRKLDTKSSATSVQRLNRAMATTLNADESGRFDGVSSVIDT